MKIKQSILPLVALLSFLNCHFINAEETPPLKIEAGEEWKVEFTNEEGVNFFTINQKVGGDGQMMISRWPVPGGVEQIASSMQLMVNSFIEVAKENQNLQGFQMLLNALQHLFLAEVCLILRHLLIMLI